MELFADVSGATSYKWDLGNGNVFENKSNRVTEVYYMSGDSIPIQLWAISERNCKTAFTSYVSVSAMDKKVLPDNSFTGTVKDWNVFPIPFQHELKVTAILQRNENVRLDLFTADGKWIKTWTLAGKKGDNVFTLNTSDLKANIMYFIVGFYNGEKHTDKIYKN